MLKHKIKVYFNRVNNWFFNPSLLSLLVSLVIPGVFGLLFYFLLNDSSFSNYLSIFLQMSSDSGIVPYEVWVGGITLCVYGLTFSISHWFFDLVAYIISLFRKSSVTADDK